jgi:hypothetical protein
VLQAWTLQALLLPYTNQQEHKQQDASKAQAKNTARPPAS